MIRFLSFFSVFLFLFFFQPLVVSADDSMSGSLRPVGYFIGGGSAFAMTEKVFAPNGQTLGTLSLSSISVSNAAAIQVWAYSNGSVSGEKLVFNTSFNKTSYTIDLPDNCTGFYVRFSNPGTVYPSGTLNYSVPLLGDPVLVPTPTPVPTPVHDYSAFVTTVGSIGAYPDSISSDYTVNAVDGFVCTSQYVFDDFINLVIKDKNGSVVPDGTYFIDTSFTITNYFVPSTDSRTDGVVSRLVFGGGLDVGSLPDGLNCRVELLALPTLSTEQDQSTNGVLSVSVWGSVAVVDGKVASIPFTYNLDYMYRFSTPGDKNYNLDNLATYCTYYSSSTSASVPVNLRFISDSLSDFDAIKGVQDSVDKVNDTLQNQFDQEQEKGDQASSDAQGAVDTLTNDIRSKWEILWYPITFTGNLLDVFVNGTSGASTYSARYANVVGYSYDSDTGMLLPVRSYTRDVSSGSSITFPAYTLPVLDVQLWDSYTFDLSFLRDDFPELFAFSDTVITAIEVLWLIAFLRDKYLEVFAR